MTLDAALWASSTALTGKAALAFWIAAFLFQCFNRRKTAYVWHILLTISAVAGCIFSSMHAPGPVTQWLWIISSLVASFGALLNIRQWTKTSPRETFEEASQLDPAIKKKSSAAKSSRLQTLKAKPTKLVQWMDLLGLVMVTAAIAISVYASLSSAKANAWLSTVHVLAACMLWGVAVFCAVELTFGSAPLSLSAVSWSGVAAVALGCWMAESCIAAAIVLSPVDSSADFQSVAMTRLYAISILLMDFVVWMIPHRVATFKRTGKATAWVSLTMAAWIGVLSLAVLCALPSTWPWQSI
jgi:hypothetical protein